MPKDKSLISWGSKGMNKRNASHSYIKYKDNKFLELIIFSILNIITENIEIIAPKDNIK